ncbi:hypothetical protein PSHT_08568 [Puccinia striiformis]|uniref:DUF659 domain-containing protein n=1 Tax=Puccinia striiformis TaxID=27350 RepID=A0A2S4VMW6_9BASI|nr:hypothetical protein PSHT_08568 [Puccinia striiformis]
MPRNRKRPRRSSPTPSSPQPERSDPRSQSPEPDTIDPDIVVVDDDRSTGAETSHELTDAEELFRAQRKAKNAVSTAYAYYGIPELSTQRDKRGRYMIAYPCNMCNERMHRPTYDLSCSNLLKHVAGCQLKHRDASGNQSLASLGVSGTGDIDPQEVNQLCALWCADAARPFSALSDESHKRILHPTIIKHLPSAKVVSRSIHMIYTAVQDDYREVLKKHTGAMYLGADAWQSPNGHDILGIVIYRLVEKDGVKFELEAMPLDFVRLVKNHTGEYLAETMRVVVEKFGVQDKICGIVTDNASNNLSMMAEIKKFKWPRFKGETHWIRCFAHILNLIVQSILRPFGKVIKKTNGNVNLNLDEESEKGSDDEDAEDELSIEDIHDLSDEDEEQDTYTSVSCKETLPKFHAIARKLRKSPNSKAEFVQLCEEQQCSKPHEMFALDGTRLFSSLKESFDDRKYGLARRYHINRIDIQLAQDLVAILELFYEQTLQVSTLGSARLTHIIVFIDEITDHLSNAIKGDGNNTHQSSKCLPIWSPADQQIYTLTDCSPLYRIAMVLHPSFKDKYFKIAGWEADWITEALRLTREMFNTFYKPNVTFYLKSTKQIEQEFQPKTGNIAQLALAAQPGLSANDPLDTWLASGLILDNGLPVNALKWWIRQKRAGNSHGGLLRMALDVLSCPGGTQSSTTRVLTDEQELRRIVKLHANQLSACHTSFDVPRLSDPLDKHHRKMIAFPCKSCGKHINWQAYENSTTNLAKHVAGCLKKQQDDLTSQKLVALGVSGTGDIDPREVPQLCAIWCAEGARPFSALGEDAHRGILHSVVLKTLPTRKAVLRDIGMLYTAVQKSFIDTLKKHQGAMYLGLDTWQSPNGLDVLDEEDSDGQDPEDQIEILNREPGESEDEDDGNDSPPS